MWSLAFFNSSFLLALDGSPYQLQTGVKPQRLTAAHEEANLYDFLEIAALDAENDFLYFLLRISNGLVPYNAFDALRRPKVQLLAHHIALQRRIALDLFQLCHERVFDLCVHNDLELASLAELQHVETVHEDVFLEQRRGAA